MHEALQYSDPEKLTTVHSHVAKGGTMSNREGIRQGQGFGIASAKEGLLEYFQAVDHGLHRYLRDEASPLVLAGADFLLPIYREASEYKNILTNGVEGNPDRWSNQELHQKAWAIAEPH